MIRALFLILFAFLIFSCSENAVKEKEKIDLSINFNTSSTIIFHYQNAQDSTFLTTSFYNLFPSDYIKSKALFPKKNGTKVLTFKIQHPKKINLGYGYFAASCFLIPNDTLEMHINLDSNQNIKRSMRFVGKHSAINNFYKNKELYFNMVDAQMSVPKVIAFNSQNTLLEYSEIMDSLTKIELDYINNYTAKELLPNWFIDYELSEIKCFTAGSKLIIVPYRRDFLKQEINIPKNYYNKIDSLMKDFLPSTISSSYYTYLERMFQYEIAQLELPDSVLSKKLS